MNKYNTVLGQMLDLISRSRFERLVKEHKTEKGAKRLRSWTQFVTMLFSRLTGQHGLRSMEQGMNSQRNGWYHLGITNTERQVKRSTLSYANAHRSADLFKLVYASLLIQAQLQKPSHGFRFKDPLYSIDSTVAGVYKDRWQIELFFKAVKQNLKIKRFYGNSRNAVMTQIWIAMIAYLLFYLLKVKSRNFGISFTQFILVIKTMLFQRVSLYDFLSGTSPPLKHKKLLECQPEFAWKGDLFWTLMTPYNVLVVRHSP